MPPLNHRATSRLYPNLDPNVRRAKVLFFQRELAPPGNWVAPAGSNRSGGGGNEAAEASGVEGHFSDLASRQAITRVNTEQASKRIMWEPTRH